MTLEIRADLKYFKVESLNSNFFTQLLRLLTALCAVFAATPHRHQHRTGEASAHAYALRSAVKSFSLNKALNILLLRYLMTLRVIFEASPHKNQPAPMINGALRRI
jgi:hypothetical protein